MSSAFPAGVPGLPGQHIPIKQRNTFVASWYLQNPHRDESMPVFERVDGEKVPIYSHGVHVTIGHILPERRYAVDLEGVLLPQKQFEALHLQHYEGWFDLNEVDPNERPEPDYRFVPDVRKFVCEVIDDAGKHSEIGFDRHKPPAPAAPVRQDVTDIIDPEVLAQAGYVRVEDGQSASDMVPQSEVNALHAKVASLEERLEKAVTALEAAAKPKPERPTIKAPCGKELKGGLPLHMKHCKEPACNEPEGDEAA